MVHPAFHSRRKFTRRGLPLMLQLFLGSKASVVTYRSDQSIAMKEQYYRFRDRSAVIMLVRGGEEPRGLQLSCW